MAAEIGTIDLNRAFQFRAVVQGGADGFPQLMGKNEGGLVLNVQVAAAETPLAPLQKMTTAAR